MNDDLALLPSPVQILTARSSAEWRDRIDQVASGSDGTRRVDRIAAICTRLFLHVRAAGYAPGPNDMEHFAEFMLMPTIPNDLRASIMLDLAKHLSAVVPKPPTGGGGLGAWAGGHGDPSFTRRSWRAGGRWLWGRALSRGGRPPGRAECRRISCRETVLRRGCFR